MFGLIANKELKNIIQSAKFSAVFLTLSILLLLSFIIGINEYKDSSRQYNTAQVLVKESMSSAKSWRALGTKIYRKPTPLQIFSGGINYDIGRYSNVNHSDQIKLQSSLYTDNPVFALFRNLDYTAIAIVVFSLFSILFSYNAVNGEKESGTLKLVFSNSVSRVKYIIAKFTGLWLGLVVPLLIPVLLGILLILLFGISLSADDYGRIATIILLSIIYLSFFLALGVFISALTKSTSTSFMILLVFWIAVVFIVPRLGVMAASQIVDVPSIAQIEARQEAFSKERWDTHFAELSDNWQKRQDEMQGLSEVEKEIYEDDHSYEWMKQDDRRRNEVDADIADYSRKLNEDYINKKSVLHKLALALSGISPASLFQLSVMNLTFTDIDQKQDYEEALRNYKTDFSEFVNEKQSESGNAGMMTISIGSNGFNASTGREQSELDLSEVPQFNYPNFREINPITKAGTDGALLFLYTAVCFLAAFMAFQKFDLR